MKIIGVDGGLMPWGQSLTAISKYRRQKTAQEGLACVKAVKMSNLSSTDLRSDDNTSMNSYIC